MAQWSDDQALTKTLVKNILYTSLHFSKSVIHADVVTEKFNMPMSNIQLLFAVEDEELTVGELADYLGVHKPNVAPIVNSLEESGYIERKPSTQDRRKIYVKLLPKGEKMCQDVRACICEKLIQENDVMGMTEAKGLNRSLSSLVRIMDIDRKAAK